MQAPEALWERPLERLTDALRGPWRDQSDADRLVDAVRREWHSAGSPLLIEHPNGVVAAHPLITVMQSAEKDAARYGEALGLKPGRVAHCGPAPLGSGPARP
jgi:hypothetical protein